VSPPLCVTAMCLVAPVDPMSIRLEQAETPTFNCSKPRMSNY
jgi:hypothetical protein